VADALRERSKRIYSKYGTVMLDTSGMSAAGIERKATSRALYSKVQYLTQCEALLGLEAAAKGAWVGGRRCGEGKAQQRTSKQCATGFQQVKMSSMPPTNYKLTSPFVLPSLPHHFTHTHLPPPHPTANPTTVDLRDIFGATEEDAARLRIVSLYDVDLDKLVEEGAGTPGGEGGADEE
jgi:hypothetical protein